MPELPINGKETEIFATTLGIMLYPGPEQDERAKATAFTSQYLATPVNRLLEDSGSISSDYERELYSGAGVLLGDIQKRWQSAEWVGDYMMTMATLCMSHPEYASQENAIRIMLVALGKAKKSGARSSILDAVKRYSGVAHLWAAWRIRGGFFVATEQTDNWARKDFITFLAESQSLLNFGLEWERPGVRHGKKTMMDANAWCVPKDWPEYYEQVGDEGVSAIPRLRFCDEQLLELKKIPGVNQKPNVQK